MRKHHLSQPMYIVVGRHGIVAMRYSKPEADAYANAGYGSVFKIDPIPASARQKSRHRQPVKTPSASRLARVVAALEAHVERHPNDTQSSERLSKLAAA